MNRGDILWGDLFLLLDPQQEVRERAAHVQSTIQEEEALGRLEAAGEALLWAQPFARHLELSHPHAPYDLRSMPDEDWRAFMIWVHGHGWNISNAMARDFVFAIPASKPASVWPPPRDFGPAEVSVTIPRPAAAKKGPALKGAPRPIFCDGGEKCKEGCPYVHGDTIPVNPLTCQFGDACSKRHALQGRTPCTRLHPDEGEWNASMVRHRPHA